MRPCEKTLKPELSEKELAFLLQTIDDRNFTGLHLEVGTAAGGTLCQMMRRYDPETRPQFVVVDPMTYFPFQLKKVKENLRSHDLDPALVDFRVKKSAEALRESIAKQETFDLIFIDGNHKCRYILQDLIWSKLLSEKGLLILHDYSSKTPGVIWAVQRFLGRNRQYKKIAKMGTLLVIQKEPSLQSTRISWFDRFLSEILTPLTQWQQSIRKRLKNRKRQTF